MKKTILLLFLSVKLFAQTSPHEENIIIIKFSDVVEKGIQDDSILSMEELSNGLKIDECIKMFESSPGAQKSKYLKNIFRIKLEGQYNVKHISKELSSFSNVIYATPSYIEQPFEIPNDTFAAPGNLQDHLAVIKAYDAWEINNGDSSVVIGIIDGAIDYNHEDLFANLQVNKADPINGEDDDNNGYVDDHYGYDFADRDNDPTSKASSHGMRVAGISSAVTNNGKGIAGTGYESRIVPLKVIADARPGIISRGYDAIVYAADRGIDVLNLSWGGVGSFSRFRQNIIDYAVLEKNVIIVAAAGNTPEELEFYPASYENVLSVGASKTNDEKAAFATYSYKIDLMAPGENVYTLDNDNKYTYSGSGSSFSAPQVAGAAAIVKHHFSNYNAKQVMERLRVTADNIDNISGNTSFEGKLGNGRLNMLRALTDPQRPSVRFEKIVLKSPIENAFFFGDTVKITGTFTNYLEATSEGNAVVSSLSPYVSVLQGEYSLEQLITGQSTNNSSSPFKIVLNENTPPGERIALRIDYSDQTGYKDFEYILLYTEPDHLDIRSGDFSVSASSSGKIGRNEENNLSGAIQFRGHSLINSAGLVISNSPDTVYDNAIINKSDATFQNDFESKTGIKYYSNSIAQQYAYSEFQTTLSSSGNLVIEQSLSSFENNNNIILLQYRIVNNGNSAVDSLNLGLLIDYDIGEANKNSSGYDTTENLGYSFGVIEDIGSPVYSGIVPLTTQQASFATVDFNDVQDIDNTINKGMKYSLVSLDTFPSTVTGMDTDVLNSYGMKVGNISAHSSSKVAFAFVTGLNLNELKSNASKAKDQYNDWIKEPPYIEENIVCKNDSITLSVPAGYTLYSDPALSSLISNNGSIHIDPLSSDTLYYAVNKTGDYDSDIFSFKVPISNVKAEFNFSNDTILLGGNTNNEVKYLPNTEQIATFDWSLANGLRSSLPTPYQTFDMVGTHVIRLITRDTHGCPDTTSKNLTVVIPGTPPMVNDITICKGGMAEINASNASRISIYSDSLRKNLLYTGTNYNSSPITTDTSFYVTNRNESVESVPVKTRVLVTKVKADFSVTPDLNLNSPVNSVQFANLSDNAGQVTWFLDGQNKGTDSVISVQAAEGSDNLMQIVKTDNGCSDTLISVVNYSKSSVSEQSSQKSCFGESFLLSPIGGHVFSFYADNQKQNLLHRGPSYKIVNVTEAKTIYVSNLDGLIESQEVKAMDITPVSLPNSIMSSAGDSLVQNPFRKTSTFTLNEGDVNSYLWKINGESVDQTASPTFFFDTLGIYNVQVILGNSLGCTDTLAKTFSVVTPQVVTTVGKRQKHNITIYPNPFSNLLKIELGVVATGIVKIQNSAGQNMFTKNFLGKDKLTINLSSIASGTYSLVIQLPNFTINRKIIKL